MLKVHSNLRDDLIVIDVESIDALLPIQAYERKIDNLNFKLSVFNAVNKKLQRANATVHIAWAYFDTLIEGYPSLSDALVADASIVRNKHFESGIHSRIPKKIYERGKLSPFTTTIGQLQKQQQSTRRKFDSRACGRALAIQGNLWHLCFYWNETYFTDIEPVGAIFLNSCVHYGGTFENGTLPSKFDSELFFFINRDISGIEDIKIYIVHQ